MDRTSASACKHIRPSMNISCIQVAGAPSDREQSQTHRLPAASFPARDSTRSWDRNQGDDEILCSSPTMREVRSEAVPQVRAASEAASGLQQTALQAVKFPA